MKPIIFLAGAEEDLVGALAYYGRISPNLHTRLMNELKTTLARIAQAPSRWQKIDAGIRKLAMDRFPYAVLYQDEEAEIRIVAIAHFKREPGYWKKKDSTHRKDT